MQLANLYPTARIIASRQTDWGGGTSSGFLDLAPTETAPEVTAEVTETAPEVTADEDPTQTLTDVIAAAEQPEDILSMIEPVEVPDTDEMQEIVDQHVEEYSEIEPAEPAAIPATESIDQDVPQEGIGLLEDLGITPVEIGEGAYALTQVGQEFIESRLDIVLDDLDKTDYQEALGKVDYEAIVQAIIDKQVEESKDGPQRSKLAGKNHADHTPAKGHKDRVPGDGSGDGSGRANRSGATRNGDHSTSDGQSGKHHSRKAHK